MIIILVVCVRIYFEYWLCDMLLICKVCLVIYDVMYVFGMGFL